MITRKHQNKLITQQNPLSNIAEQYRIVRTNIQYSSYDKELRLLMITSPTPGDGKTTTIANLGVVMAQQGKRVLLIDADLRKPSLNYHFNMNNYKGLTNVFTGNHTLSDVVVSTNEKNLSLLASGPIPPNPSELLSSMKMFNLLARVKNIYDVVLVDSPPVLDFSDAQVLGNICDGIILVFKSGKTNREEALSVKNSLMNCKAKIIGGILNQKKGIKPNEYFRDK